MVSGGEKRASSPTHSRAFQEPPGLHRDGAAVSIAGRWIVHGSTHTGQGHAAPDLGSSELPRCFRSFPSWHLPTHPRTVLADAWRACSDVSRVYLDRAICRCVQPSLYASLASVSALTGQPNYVPGQPLMHLV